MRINAVNVFNTNLNANKNNKNNKPQMVAFGYGDEITPSPVNDFKDLTGGNGNTKETFVLLCKIPQQWIKEALGIKPKKNPNEEDPEDFFKQGSSENFDNMSDEITQE